MPIKLTEDEAATAVYLAKLEEHYIKEIREAESLEKLRELVSSFVLEHYQHELDMAAIRLLGDKPRERGLAEEAEAIKARIAEIRKQ